MELDQSCPKCDGLKVVPVPFGSDEPCPVCVTVTVPKETARDTRFADPNAVIGYLTPHPSGYHYGLLCPSCVMEKDVNVSDVGAAVYGININPYKATCVRCKKVIVEGCGTELYDGGAGRAGRRGRSWGNPKYRITRNNMLTALGLPQRIPVGQTFLRYGVKVQTGDGYPKSPETFVVLPAVFVKPSGVAKRIQVQCPECMDWFRFCALQQHTGSVKCRKVRREREQGGDERFKGGDRGQG